MIPTVLPVDAMKRDDVLLTLKQAEPSLRAQGVARAAVFGSVARGDQGPDSDIDIMVEIEPDVRMGVYQYVGLVQAIEDLFPVPVDVADRQGLKPYIRSRVEREAVYAF